MDVGEFLDDLRKKVISVTLVGSRETCNPPPVDTDQDVLVLMYEGTGGLFGELFSVGFDIDGSQVRDPADHLGDEGTFQSFSKGDLNLIVTQDPEFHRRFLAATSVAKKLNLLEKADRIDLFQAVLYGNPVEVPQPPSADDDLLGWP
jgi:hypothetical protein